MLFALRMPGSAWFSVISGPLVSARGGAGVSLGVAGLGGAQIGALTTYGMAERIAARNSAPVTINVTGGISTSAEIGQSVLNSLLAYQRSNGPLDLQIA